MPLPPGLGAAVPPAPCSLTVLAAVGSVVGVVVVVADTEPPLTGLVPPAAPVVAATGAIVTLKGTETVTRMRFEPDSETATE